MAPTEKPLDPQLRTLLIQKHIDYQIALVNRRWQYFATSLILNGLLLNAWRELSAAQPAMVESVVVGSIVALMVLLQLVGLATKRIERSQIILKWEGTAVLDVPVDGQFRLISVTVLLYIAIIAISSLWFQILFFENIYAFSAMAAVFLVNLRYLRWVCPDGKKYPGETLIGSSGIETALQT